MVFHTSDGNCAVCVRKVVKGSPVRSPEMLDINLYFCIIGCL